MTTTMTIPTTRICDLCGGDTTIFDAAEGEMICPACDGEGRLTARPLPSVSVERFKCPANRRCEFLLATHPEETCGRDIEYSVTPPTHKEDERVHPDDEFTSYVCLQHLGRTIALRLAGVY